MFQKTFQPEEIQILSKMAMPILNHLNLLDHTVTPDEYDGKKHTQIICTLPQRGERAVTLAPEERLLSHSDTDSDFVIARVSSVHDVPPDLWMITKVSTFQAYLLPINALDENGCMA